MVLLNLTVLYGRWLGGFNEIQFRFLLGPCLVNIKGSVGLIKLDFGESFGHEDFHTA